MSPSDGFPPGEPESRSALSGSLRILLIVSLALNMFFVGAGVVLLGRGMTHPDRPFQVRMRGEFPGPGMMLRALPEETRKRIEKQIEPERTAMRNAMAAARQARREAFTALSAQPFSSDLYEQKLEAAEAADVAAVRAVHEMLAKTTVLLTPEERTQVAAAMKTQRFERGFGKGPPGGPGAGSPSDGSPSDGPPPDGRSPDGPVGPGPGAPPSDNPPPP